MEDFLKGGGFENMYKFVHKTPTIVPQPESAPNVPKLESAPIVPQLESAPIVPMKIVDASKTKFNWGALAFFGGLIIVGGFIYVEYNKKRERERERIKG